MSRFADLTDGELTALWEAVTVDDGIQYGIETDDPLYRVAREIHDEAVSRGLTGHFWFGVLG